MDYKKAYATLIGTISNAIDEINNSCAITQELKDVIQILKAGLEKAEEMYLSSDE